MHRLSIRKRIHAKSWKLYNAIKNDTLRNLVEEIRELNEEYVLSNPDTIKTKSILKQGFSDNQKRWIERLNMMLR